ncbi:MAG TPA: DISARM system helicase DrmA [Caulobacteraceae bacterium]|jgi:hypothetical protein|nr:DISARM system helicase DrmA [Caulobacteraceae bacterium]
MTTSKDVRDTLVHALRRDLVGPAFVDVDLAQEILNTSPSRWYLTGFLAPAEGARAEEADPDGFEDMDGDGASADLDDEADAPGGEQQPDGAAAKRKFVPSSIGLSLLLEREVRELEVEVSWGDYVPEPRLDEGLFAEDAESDAEGQHLAETARRLHWRRIPRSETLKIAIPREGREPAIAVAGSGSPVRRGGGLELVAHTKRTKLPIVRVEREVTAVSLFLVNRRRPTNRWLKDATYVFQAKLRVRSQSPIVARPDLSGYDATDEDLRVADLHYADVCEFAVGHNCSADWPRGPHGSVHTVWTEPLPQAEVERVAANEEIEGVQFGMMALAEAAKDRESLCAALTNLPHAYSRWIAQQDPSRFDVQGEKRMETAKLLVQGQRQARDRIAAGLDRLLNDDDCRHAFRLMNQAMAEAGRQREAATRKVDPESLPWGVWRPFQLAFILLNIEGLAEPTHRDRETVDLLFFPTGGGKTEAYLGLAAFGIAHRRATRTGRLGAGVAVMMRYTLRLLTLDQLGRAAGLICALELLREDPANRLGGWPIEIGLWVGSAASPNRLNDGTEYSAAARVRKFRRDNKVAPAPIKNCPWCGAAFDRDTFRLWPSEKAPTRLELRCSDPTCHFTGNRRLPILVTDEEIYRRLPAFLIATVDKFAALAWEGNVGAFFGHVDRTDAEGFLGPSEAGGSPLEALLQPPSLIIQDELHLITGPLGTVAGLYECAIDALSSRTLATGEVVRPKIVASTATARRASSQIEDLFDRSTTHIFPPPGIDRKDSFFARTQSSAVDPARLYVGVSAPGKGQKLVFLRALRTLMAAAQKAYEDSGPLADPYLSAVCYFNALRELGSARRIVEDEVRSNLRDYGARRRRVEPPGAEFADRTICADDPLELTSRVSTDDVAKAKARLQTAFPKSARARASNVCDVALATNMISVGLDITRLGLMVVNGQPKTAAEYIQATSRVGRDQEKPGLVVTVLNPHKPRDRAHYESFRHFHEAFYRAIEGASVTPWAARAMDRALAAVTVSLARHLDPGLTPNSAAGDVRDHIAATSAAVHEIVRRSASNAPHRGRTPQQRAEELIAAWGRIAADAQISGATLGYGKGGGNRRLLRDFLEPGFETLSPDEQKFRAPRSMRGVENSVRLRLRSPFDGWL